MNNNLYTKIINSKDFEHGEKLELISAINTKGIKLDEYEIANLQQLLELVMYESPFNAAHTGDWTGQILMKLQRLNVDYAPNMPKEEILRRNK